MPFNAAQCTLWQHVKCYWKWHSPNRIDWFPLFEWWMSYNLFNTFADRCNNRADANDTTICTYRMGCVRVCLLHCYKYRSNDLSIPGKWNLCNCNQYVWFWFEEKILFDSPYTILFFRFFLLSPEIVNYTKQRSENRWPLSSWSRREREKKWSSQSINFPIKMSI